MFNTDICLSSVKRSSFLFFPSDGSYHQVILLYIEFRYFDMSNSCEILLKSNSLSQSNRIMVVGTLFLQVRITRSATLFARVIRTCKNSPQNFEISRFSNIMKTLPIFHRTMTYAAVEIPIPRRYCSETDRKLGYNEGKAPTTSPGELSLYRMFSVGAR